MSDFTVSTPYASPSTIRRLHSGISIAQYYSMHFMGGLFPFVAGVALFGWRAAAAMLLVVASALLTVGIWRSIGSRGRQLSTPHVLWHAMLLGLMLPAQLASAAHAGHPEASWPLLVAAGAGLVAVIWICGGLASVPAHPAAVVYLLLTLSAGAYLAPTGVLDRKHLVTGDVVTAGLPDGAAEGGSLENTQDRISPDPWLKRRSAPRPGFRAEAPAVALTQYTTGRLRPDRGQMPLHELLRDRLPPLEDLVIGGQPAAIGLGSAISVIVGGLFLLYRGLIDFRIPLFVCLCAFLALLILPVPTVLRADGPHFHWLALRQSDVRWETALTFVNYELMASPTLFVAFFLATAPALRPLSRRARAIYACIIGLLCAASQLYVSAVYGPYLAVVAGGLASPILDRWFRPRPLV